MGILHLLGILEDPSDFDSIDYIVAVIYSQSALLALRVPRHRDELFVLPAPPHDVVPRYTEGAQ